MAVTNFSPLLGLALPTTGDLSGTWGTTVNDSITGLLDSAVAGTTTLSTDADVTLTTTNGAANQARNAVLLCTGARTTLKTITAPAQSKAYIVINATTGGFSVKVVGSGPTTPGVTVANGEKALIAWNGSDFVLISKSVIDLTADVKGILPVVNGGTGQTSYTNGQLLIGNTTGNTLTKATLTQGTGITITNGNGAITIANSGGDVVGPASATANGIALFDGTTGKLLKNSSAQDGLIYGLTVGRGAGAVNGNTAVGASALSGNTTGSDNTGVGFSALAAQTTGTGNTALGLRAAYLGTAFTNVVAIGANALAANTASDNTAVGTGAAAANTSGTNNTVVGRAAFASNTTGGSNTALGHQSLQANTTASSNTAVGYQAAYANTTGSGITAIGSNALDANTTGINNIAVGLDALGANTTGAYHTAVGHSALKSNTTNNFNSAFGYAALRDNTTGTSNNAFAYAALIQNTTGSNNVAVGHESLYSNTTASNNTAVGYQAGYSNTTGAGNVAVGYQAAYTNTTGLLTAIGYKALYSNATTNYGTAIGYQAATNSIADHVTAIGNNALRDNTTGAYNIAVGGLALQANTTAANNTAVGFSALLSNTTGANNTAVGYQAGYTNTTGGFGVYLGYQAGYTTNATYGNVCIGYRVGYSLTGGGNTLVGALSTAGGDGAGTALTTGTQNSFFGTSAGNLVTTGSKNVIIGSYSGNQGSLDIRTASNYIVLSDGDGNPRGIFNSTGTFLVNSTATTPSGNTSIKLNTVGQIVFASGTATTGDVAKGYINFLPYNSSVNGSNSEAWANLATGVFIDSQIESGNDALCNSALLIRGQQGGSTNPGALIRAGTGANGSSSFTQQFRVLYNGNVANSNGTYGTLSDARAKQDIIDASSQWDDIKAVRVRKYRLISDVERSVETGIEAPYQIGVVAQELQQTSPGLVEVNGDESNMMTVKSSIMYMKAIKALQEAMQRIETLETQVAALRAQ